MAAARTDARAVVLLSAGLVALGGGCSRPTEAERLMRDAEEIEAEDLVDQLESLRDEAGRGLDVAGELREVKDELERRKANARDFNSTLAFRVDVERGPMTSPVETGVDEIGRTPAAEPIAIPPCISWWVRPVGDVSDPEALRAIAAEVQRLRVPGLFLPRPGITDAGLAHLKGLTGLRKLVLNSNEVTDAGLGHLKGLTGLRELHLWRTEVTDAGLAHLKGLTGLRELWLHRTGITDAGLPYLKGLTGLRELYLFDTEITDAGLARLEGLTGLRRLGLGRTHASNAGVRALEEALPQLKVFR